MKVLYFFLCAVVLTLCEAKKDERECEVCIAVVNKLLASLKEKKIEITEEVRVEQEVKNVCKDLKGKEEKFCYYIGATPTSATYIVRELTKPLARFLPPEKACLRLKEKDSQICELQFDRTVDWKTVDLNKLKVKDLRKILDDWGEQCKACTEKSEFVKRVQELMPKYVKSEL